MKTSLPQLLRQFVFQVILTPTLIGLAMIFVSLYYEYRTVSNADQVIFNFFSNSIREDLLRRQDIVIKEKALKFLFEKRVASMLIVTNTESIFEETVARPFFKKKLTGQIYFGSNINEPAGEIEIMFSYDFILHTALNLVAAYLIVLTLILMLVRRFFKQLSQGVVIPLQTLVTQFSKTDNTLAQVEDFGTVTRELELLRNSFNDMSARINLYQTKVIEQTHNLAFAMLAQQVSHDIRSPLSALNMILQNLNQVPEEKRLIIRNAVERINDIANTLLSKAKNLNASNSIEGRFSNVNFLSESSDLIVELIPALVDILISEKRIQFRESFNVQISSDLQGSYGAFASINPLEFKRMLSNLINNSFESFELRGGKIHVSVLAKSRDVEIIIKDTGKGIPDHILKKIGEPGVTFGKSAESKSGTGLGLYHAKKTVEKFGGELLISSELGQGTTVKISLPKSNPPKWFVSELRLVANQTIVVLDDDISIHSIWKGRLESLNAKTHNINLVGFTSAIEFKNWVLALPIQTKVLFLIDYELINQSQTGLDLIEELKISAYLVTSRFEEKSILERCERLNLCLIPKSMASLLPIKISEAPILFDWILIDDDPLVHMTWDLAAKNYEKRFRGYFNFQDFEQNKNSFDFNSTIYIDANLSDNVRGEDVAESIFALGFINIFIATGYPEDQIKQSNFIKAVVGKNPPI